MKTEWAEQLTKFSRSRDPKHVELGPVRTHEGTLLLPQVFQPDRITSGISVFTQNYIWARLAQI